MPRFGLRLGVEVLPATAQRPCDAGTAFVIEPYAGSRASRTMLLLDPAGNAPEFTAFRDPARLFAR